MIKNILKANFAGICLLVFVIIILPGCSNSNQTDNDDQNQIEETSTDAISEVGDSRIIYDPSLTLSCWVALYDSRKKARCFMSHDDYYSIKEPNMNGNLKEEYSYLIPLGMVLKYSGAPIIWGFNGVESVSWKGAKEYADNYSPDGKKWRLLTRTEASAIKTNKYNFVKSFETYYPNDLSYLGAYRSIENWTSTLSDEVWTRKKDGIDYKKVYTIDIYGDDCEIRKEFTTYEEDLHNVYPISSL